MLSSGIRKINTIRLVDSFLHFFLCCTVFQLNFAEWIGAYAAEIPPGDRLRSQQRSYESFYWTKGSRLATLPSRFVWTLFSSLFTWEGRKRVTPLIGVIKKDLEREITVFSFVLNELLVGSRGEKTWRPDILKRSSLGEGCVHYSSS